MAKLLVLSSNPRRDLNLDREISDLTTAIQRLGAFEIRLGLEVRPQELTEKIAEHNPQIVHYCGHGAGEQGLVFQNENGKEVRVSTEVLARIFKTFSDVIDCTVLNACDSDCQAAAIMVDAMSVAEFGSSARFERRRTVGYLSTRNNRFHAGREAISDRRNRRNRCNRRLG